MFEIKVLASLFLNGNIKLIIVNIKMYTIINISYNNNNILKDKIIVN